MVKKELINLFKTNTDADAVNRGYYYQYLVTLKKWLLNYINKTDNFIFCEVEDDIKEIGDKLVFTQVKCYSRNFSLKSSEIKHTLYNFFIHFLLNKETEEIEFCFFTNTGIARNEKLLDAWIKCPDLSDEVLYNQVLKKIQEIINSEINKRKRKKLEKKGLTAERKLLIKDAVLQLKNENNNLAAIGFLRCVKWNFLSIDSIEAVDKLFDDVRKLLRNDIFGKRSVRILESVLLSEVFRCSQLTNENERVLTNDKIDQIIGETEEGLASYVDYRFIELLGVRLEEIDQQYKELKNNQVFFEKRLDSVEEKFAYSFENNKEDIPKYLTILPSNLNEEQYGRDKLFHFFESELLKYKCLSINGIGGAGKSFFVQKYIKKNIDDYKHIAWIDASPILSKSILLNLSLIKNLGLEYPARITEEAQIDLICNELQQLKGRKVLIIDNFDEEISVLRKLTNLSDWEIIVTSRRILPNTHSFELPKISIEFAIEIFNANCLGLSERTERSLYEEFIDYVDYNPLVIKLCAQTISNSTDLSLKVLFDSIKERNLDSEELAIELDPFGEDYPQTILSYLFEKFDLDRLTIAERSIISFLALLPLEDIDLIDLSLIGGEEFKDKNLKEFTNVTNSLYRKGWLEKAEGMIKMYRLVQEIIIYKERSALNSFAQNMIFINWLMRRIDENSQSDPSLSFRFLKYAESILNIIKEEYRQSLYQPLLILENALLSTYNWVDNSDGLHERWVELIQRSEKYLAYDDGNLGIMYNNLGFSFARRGNHSLAISCFRKSIDTLKRKESDNFRFLINSNNNLAQNFLALNDIESVTKTLSYSDQLIKKYPNRDTQFLAVTSHLKAILLINEEDFEKALIYCELAIENHLIVDKDKRNDLLLLVYYSDLIYILFKLRQHNQIDEYMDKINSLIKDSKLKYLSLLDEVKEMVNSIHNYSKENG